MLELTNEDRKRLNSAITSAYPDFDDLAFFVDYELNQSLNNITGSGLPHKTVVYRLIKWAIAKGYIDALVLALYRDTKNPDIQNICGCVLKQYVSLNEPESFITGANLELDQLLWDIDSSADELESFFPRRFTFEADVGQLQKGLALARSICKITFANRSQGACGTGVLISPDLVLTNYHVLSLEQDVDLNTLGRAARFEFGYISGQGGDVAKLPILKASEQNPVVLSSPIDELDFALLRVVPDEAFRSQPVEWDISAKLGPRSPLNILQHPEGEAMKISLSNNGVVKTEDDKGLVLYVNATKRGSSGAPCFDENWKLVALHHKNKITSFGSVREGILFSAIYPRIKSLL